MDIKSNTRKLSIIGINLSITLLIIIIICGLPFAIKSIYNEVVSNASDSDRFTLIEPNKFDDFTQLGILTKELDPINQTIKITVSGYHNCQTRCNKKSLRLHISSYYLKNANEKRVPESFVIDIPKGGTEFEKEIVLPVSGDIHEYPYDSYSVQTAIALESIVNGISTFSNKESNAIAIILDEQTSRLQDIKHTQVSDLKTVITEHPPIVAFSSDYERPFYVKYIVTLLVILLLITTAATIFLSDFSKLITGSAGIIIGVWGTRSLLLGSLPADVTIIDIILTLIVIGTLICVAIKSALHTRKNIKRD